ncbi:hypothetical protein HMPREF1979_00883 [Actinomyces johnsonii F0542]|uniref:Uncharacterized protein n=1 Tax=Actinomyces johnsonii F0542 TaxID=1321818 RepID=U1QB52_9ACTO|nr:hypothetical protein HMPREF1979_00883 [Actinomyces johnsonii F0542]
MSSRAAGGSPAGQRYDVRAGEHSDPQRFVTLTTSLTDSGGDPAGAR